MNTKEILNEIYKIDESMKEYEKDLEKIIKEFIAKKPELNIDRVFVKELREKVLGQAKEQNEEKRVPFFTFTRLAFSLSGAMLMLLVLIPFLDIDRGADKMSMNSLSNQELASDSLDPDIKKQGKEAFGRLAWGDNQNSGAANTLEESSGEMRANDAPAGLGSQKMADGIGAGGGGGLPMAIEGRMVAPYYGNFIYEYVGEDLQLQDKEKEVYKLIKKRLSGLDNGISNMKEGLLDISQLDNPRLNSLNITENKEFGYSVYFNIAEGTIDINKDWALWPREDANCRTEECYLANRLKPSDVPSDETLIRIADDFLSDFSISKDNYGEPQIQDDFKKNIAQAENERDIWIPENIQVVYPLIVQGQEVYDESGRARGLNVSVDIRQMKASGAHSIRINDFASSLYKMETDFSRIVEIAEKNNSRIFYGDGLNGEEVEEQLIKLGTPEEILMAYWNYDNNKMESEELYVPALRFPIIEKPSNMPFYGGDYVVLPLAKEMLDRYDISEEPEPRPMPVEPFPIDAPHIMEDEASDASAEELKLEQE